ncbi:PREDICTED: basic leucine zipper 2 [Theobroma cacao]|uniref:Basic leucine zipper 2 n=1 Tax=Theobroma cacao TaxID=3641 RepID=A0AB32WS32_THECC|nr:PREDICTED: basic leucine zipper 2 [Theobroma cacao]
MDIFLRVPYMKRWHGVSRSGTHLGAFDFPRMENCDKLVEAMEGIKIENVEQTPDAPLPMLPSSGSGKADHEMAPADQIDQSKTGKHVPDQVRQGEGRGLGNNVDPKKLKRITAGREYSLRYRLKQQQHTAQLETDVRSLQIESKRVE